MDNSKLGARNVLWGIVAQIVTIGLGIVIPRLVLVNLGSEANGLLNSVGSMLTYLSLLEAGVGTATIQALYPPIAKKDRLSINRILSATHYFYHRTGITYLGIVLIMSFVYTLFVSTTLPRLWVFLVVLMSGLSGVISYFFQGKYRLFLAAEGKGYINHNITTVTSIGVSITKAVLLLAGANVVMIQTVYFVFNLVQMLFFVVYIHRHFAWIDLRVVPDFKAISQSKAVFVQQIANLVFYNTDNIILTVLTSLKVVSVYSMYAMIFGMVKSIAVVLSDSFIFALGQAYTDRERFLQMHNTYEVYTLSMTFSLFSVTGLLILPFLRLYTSGVNDINYVDRAVAALFLLYYLMDNGRKPAGVLINIAQHFEQTKWRAALEAIINLISSIVLTFYFGIYGVLFGTIIALLYRANDMILYEAMLLERSPWVTYRRWGRNMFLFLLFQITKYIFPIEIANYRAFLLYGIGLSLVIIPCFIAVNSLFELESAQYAFAVLEKMLRRKADST